MKTNWRKWTARIAATCLIAAATAVFAYVCYMVALKKELIAAQNTRNEVREMFLALEHFEKDVGAYPSTEQGIIALAKNPGIREWNGPYCTFTSDRIRGIEFLDHWGTPYRFSVLGKDREVRSAGLDRLFDNDDDIRFYANYELSRRKKPEPSPKNSPPETPSVGGEKTVWLDELDLGKVLSNEGEPQRNQSFGGHPLTIGGEVFERGIGLRAPASLRLILSEGTERFTALVGVDDEVASSTASVEFLVFGGSKQLWKSGVMRAGDPPKKVNLNLARIRKYYPEVKTLRLEVSDGGDGNQFDRADWADAKFEVADKGPVAIGPVATTPYILTPPPPRTPRVNGPRVFGVRTGSPFLFTGAATGDPPLTFTAEGLPEGLELDKTTGRIAGLAREKGEYTVRLAVQNVLGRDERELLIIVGDRICLIPPMGWNSWNCRGETVDDATVRAAARALVDSGLAAHGWIYVNIDDSWQGARGGPHNALQGNEKFPDMKGLCDFVHGLGLKIGIYSTPWITSYAGYPGGSGDRVDGSWIKERDGVKTFDTGGWRLGKHSFAAVDVRQWAEWGIDYLKYDWSPNDVPHAEEMAKALGSSGRDIVLSLSNSAPFELAEDWRRLANCWRTTDDLTDSWEKMTEIGFSQDRWSPFAGPGHWNDPDMLVVGRLGWGGELRPTALTPDEQYAHVSLWCLLSAPLLLGCDLENLDEFTLGLLTNDEVLEVNQDPLGRQARRVKKEGDAEVWAKEMRDGSTAAGLFNRGPVPLEVSIDWSTLGLKGPAKVRDLWRQKDQGVFERAFQTQVPSHGVILVRIAPGQE